MIRYKYSKQFIIIALIIAGGCTVISDKETLLVGDLKCEMRDNPEGIDVLIPKLSWIIENPHRNIKQKAYHILVASSPELLDSNKGDYWNSGKITSSQSVHVTYEGLQLKSRNRCYWKVKVWTEKGESEWSNTAYWSMGLLHYNDWKGRWIGLDRSFPWDDESLFSRLSARYFRKEIHTGEKEIANATLYIAGLGLYELYINGKKIGTQVLAPAPTDYSKNIKYNSFNVTDNLNKGENVIGVVLGNGRFYTMRQKYKPYKIKTFGYPKMLLNLFVTYSDGTTATFATDNSWKVTADGPIRSNNEYDGEEYDARKEMPGWNLTGFDDKKWLVAEYVQEPEGDLEARMNDNMNIMQVIKPVSVSSKGRGRFILDLGQNISGWLRVKIKGARGDRVVLRFAESLTEDGELFTANLRDAKATDIYILKGEGIETWEPAFIYHGFRFVEISELKGTPSLEDFEGCVIYDNMKTTGTFETSDSLINQIYKNAFWSIISNYKGMPVDCPQRNERVPWLGDRATSCYGESFVMDNCRLYVKWLDDIAYAQKSDGSIPDVAPPYFRYYSDNITWPGTFISVAQMLYQQYGLTDPIVKHYPRMKKWLGYMKERYMVGYILTKDSYGDWCTPPVTIEEGKGKNSDSKRPSQLISTAYFYYYLKTLQNFANLTENEEDVELFRVLADSVKVAFNKKFLNEKDGVYGANTLTDNLLPLYFGIIPETNKKEVLENIRDIIVNKNNGHLSTGMIGTQWLMRSLADNAMDDIAFNLVTNTTYPGWGYMVENGATTIWELWNGNTAAPSMNSQNHVMLLGDLVIWFYEYLAGIKSETVGGFKKIIMKPHFTNELNYVKASFQSVHGLIISHWKKENGRFVWDITIPANTTAEVYFPSTCSGNISEKGETLKKGNGINKIKKEKTDLIVEVGSGTYHFICTK